LKVSPLAFFKFVCCWKIFEKRLCNKLIKSRVSWFVSPINTSCFIV
jgi:hypothetical protein